MDKELTVPGVLNTSAWPLLSQAEIPSLPTARIQPSSENLCQIEIKNRILVFPVTPCGESTGKMALWFS